MSCTSIIVDNICFSYNKDNILQSVNMDFSQNDFILMSGPNGAGKTTLISLILGFLRPTRGSIKVNNPSKDINQQYSYLPQRASFFDVPGKALDVVASSFLTGKSFFNFGYKEHQRKALQKLEELHLLDIAHKEFRSLSGGEAQKILLARILVNPASFIFLDESFSNMDKSSRKFMMEQLYELKGKSGIFMITHDMDIIADHQDRFFYLNQGHISCYSSIRDMEESFFHDHNHECYQR